MVCPRAARPLRLQGSGRARHEMASCRSEGKSPAPRRASPRSWREQLPVLVGAAGVDLRPMVPDGSSEAVGTMGGDMGCTAPRRGAEAPARAAAGFGRLGLPRGLLLGGGLSTRPVLLYFSSRGIFLKGVIPLVTRAFQRGGRTARSGVMPPAGVPPRRVWIGRRGVSSVQRAPEEVGTRRELGDVSRVQTFRRRCIVLRLPAPCAHLEPPDMRVGRWAFPSRRPAKSKGQCMF
jgi:hypothetical protein